MADPATPLEPASAPEPGDRGRTAIAPKAVERLAVGATREVDAGTSVRRGLTGLLGGRLPRADAVVAGATSRVSVEVAAVWPESLPELALRVREHVRERVATLSGMDVTAVDVTVAEVVHRTASGPRVR